MAYHALMHALWPILGSFLWAHIFLAFPHTDDGALWIWCVDCIYIYLSQKNLNVSIYIEPAMHESSPIVA